MTDAAVDVAGKHVDALVADGKTLYGVFELIDPLPGDDPATDGVRSAVAGIVDVLDALDENPVDDVRAGIIALLEQDEHDKATVFEGWLKLLRAARPYHRTIGAICADYSRWIAGLPSETFNSCLYTMGGLCSCYGNDAHRLVDILCHYIKELAPARQTHYLEMLETYGGHLETKPLTGLMETLPLLYARDDEKLLEQFKETFTVETLAEQNDAGKCVCAIAALGQSLPLEQQALVVPLTMTAAAQSHGSATQLATRLPRKAQDTDESNRLRYIETSKTIVESAGICTVGFCLRELPGLVARVPAEELAAWVDCVRETSERYGARAAAAFVDKATSASRECWDGLGAG